MNIAKRQRKYLDLAKFLCTVTGTRKNGKARYPTLEDAAVKFDFSFSHTSRLKTAMVDEVDGVRTLKKEYDE